MTETINNPLAHSTWIGKLQRAMPHSVMVLFGRGGADCWDVSFRCFDSLLEAQEWMDSVPMDLFDNFQWLGAIEIEGVFLPEPVAHVTRYKLKEHTDGDSRE